MALNLKKFETRGKAIAHRGELAICSAKRRLKPYHLSPELRHWLEANGERFGSRYSVGQLLDHLPHGKVLGVVDLKGCLPTWTLDSLSDQERLFGNFEAGRFGWATDNLRRLKTPVPVVGRQFLFNLPPDVEKLVREQL